MMQGHRWFSKGTFVFLGFTIGFLFDGNLERLVQDYALISSAQARVGRPLTPGSVAGVARRTTRRVVRRSTIYVATLPAACVKVHINGALYWHCGGRYYAPYGKRYVVVYVH
jgi:hypothetical protein